MADERKVSVEISSTHLLKALTRAPFSIVLTDPTLDDNPIVYVNDTFEIITGYARDFAIGQNCRFLQGDDAQQEELEQLRQAILEEREITVDLCNYRPDGAVFYNRLMISPLYNREGKLVHFLGIQAEIDTGPDDKDTDMDAGLKLALEEIQHRVKNHLAMIVSMIRLQAGRQDPSAPADFDTLARRVETLQLLYEELSEKVSDDGKKDETIALGAYLSRVANAIAHVDGRSGIRVNVEAEKMSVAFETATQIGLILSELMTNALQHAFKDREEGLLEVEAKTLSNGVFRLVVSDDGVGIPDDVNWPEDGNLGGRIVRSLVSGLRAKLDVMAGDVQGTTVTLDVPKATLNSDQLAMAEAEV